MPYHIRTIAEICHTCSSDRVSLQEGRTWIYLAHSCAFAQFHNTRNTHRFARNFSATSIGILDRTRASNRPFPPAPFPSNIFVLSVDVAKCNRRIFHPTAVYLLDMGQRSNRYTGCSFCFCILSLLDSPRAFSAQRVPPKNMQQPQPRHSSLLAYLVLTNITSPERNLSSRHFSKIICPPHPRPEHPNCRCFKGYTDGCACHRRRYIRPCDRRAVSIPHMHFTHLHAHVTSLHISRAHVVVESVLFSWLPSRLCWCTSDTSLSGVVIWRRVVSNSHSLYPPPSHPGSFDYDMYDHEPPPPHHVPTQAPHSYRVFPIHSRH